ncbi:MFS transporter [Actinoplanes sp. NPDC051494]|uniref:MFS transporter n=1 Tax=Actinoplanes sp. NPDC051494 TaxID=3363907 RepID=UPI0037B8B3B8
MSGPVNAAAGLWRNRDFNLLWTSQSLSDLGTAVAGIAIPLTVLVLTGSAVQAGLVGTAAAVVRLACRLPAGVMADRLDRRRIMLTCDAVRTLAFLALGLAALGGHAGLALLAVVAVLDAGCGAVFATAEHAALRNLVPAGQLTDAFARNEARSYGTSLAGPPLGGLLFGVARSVPFFANAATYLASMVGVALIRTPMQEKRTEPPAKHGAAMAEGLRFVFGNAFLRALLAVAAPLNLAVTGILFTIIISLQQRGTPPALIGTAETMLGAGGLLGALAAPALQRRMSLPTLVRAICWAAAGLMVLSAPLSHTVLAAVPIGVAVFLGPAANAALFGYQASVTPDRLQGRVVSVILLIAMSAAAAAPILAGVLVDAAGPVPAILLFAATVLGSAVAATFGRGLRGIPAPPSRVSSPR